MSDVAEPLPPSKVLVVDDNLQNLELLEAYLEDVAEITTIGATNGQQALEKVAAERPDLILLDVMMPRMSGFEVCKKLKSDPATRHIPIIMVTALDEVGDVERGVEAGTNDFITKPVNRVDLLARVRTLLRMRHTGADDSAYFDEPDGAGGAPSRS
jgi:two-component system cell cycle response regulator